MSLYIISYGPFCFPQIFWFWFPLSILLITYSRAWHILFVFLVILAKFFRPFVWLPYSNLIPCPLFFISCLPSVRSCSNQILTPGLLYKILSVLTRHVESHVLIDSAFLTYDTCGGYSSIHCHASFVASSRFFSVHMFRGIFAGSHGSSPSSGLTDITSAKIGPMVLIQPIFHGSLMITNRIFLPLFLDLPISSMNLKFPWF